jgi:hypothetical protein
MEISQILIHSNYRVLTRVYLTYVKYSSRVGWQRTIAYINRVFPTKSQLITPTGQPTKNLIRKQHSIYFQNLSIINGSEIPDKIE